jgi:hypothetical protein
VKPSLLLGLGVWAMFVSSSALADDRAACFDSASQGQTLRDEHKLLEAREKFRVCAQEKCPISMQSDCAGWLEAVEKSIVTVVIVATDPAGNSLFDVSVRVDGQPLMTRLAGQAVPVNPGVHMFHFERDDGTTVDRAVQTNEGDKNQKIVVVLGSAPLTPPTPRRGQSAQKIVGFAGGAAGVAALVLGGVFGALTATEASKQTSDCPRSDCTAPGHAQALADHTMAVADGTVSTVAFIAGGALVLGGAVLVLATSRGSTQPVTKALGVLPSVSSRGTSLSVEGTF